MVKLYIDTSDNKKTIAKIVKDKQEFVVSSINKSARADILLKLIDKTLKKAKIRLNEVDKIYVKKGPGSFTGLRVGISVANALSFALLKEINNFKLGDIETPLY